MAGKKRTDYQKTRDRQILVKLWALDKYTQAEMAEQIQRITGADYQLSQQQISYDLNLIEEKLMEMTAKEMERAKAEEIAKLNALEMEYMQGYKKSIGEKEKHRRKVKNEDGEHSKEIQVQTEDMIGNPRWLDGVRKVIEQRSKIRGIEAPKEVNVRDMTREKFEGDDPEEFVRKELSKE